jgi:hypothetical protein
LLLSIFNCFTVKISSFWRDKIGTEHWGITALVIV